jgi:putative tryptophan/tyrosine transport system substrate-binding protein
LAIHVGRREFITLLGGAAVAWPLAGARSNPEQMRRIGFLHGLAESDPEVRARIAAFQQGLAALGWIEGRNISIDHRFASGDPGHAQAIVTEMVGTAPDLIVGQSTPVVAALKQATSTIPIVFAVLNDPVGQGLIASLARPSGNITGFTFVDFPITGKWLELLKGVAPAVDRAAVIFNPETAPYYPAYLRSFEAIPRSIAVELAAAPVHNEAEMEAAIAELARRPGGGLIAGPDPFTTTHRALLMTLAERYRLPTVYGFRQFVSEGALLSYGPDTLDIVRRSASYVDRILKGEKPADLPVQQVTKMELVINLKIAKALGLTVPTALLVRADEVFE